MQNQKTKLFFRIGLACLLVFLLTAFGCKSKEETNQTAENSVDQAEETITLTTNDAVVNTAVVPEGENVVDTNTNETVNDLLNDAVNSAVGTDTGDDDQEKVIKLATSLGEIFGTYTNKDKEPYKNFKDLKPYASKKMSGWIDNKTAKTPAPASNAPFYGVTTRVLSSAVLESNSTSYQILLTCQREEITEVTSSPKKFYQLLKINFVKEAKEWKLDGAFWQE